MIVLQPLLVSGIIGIMDINQESKQDDKLLNVISLLKEKIVRSFGVTMEQVNNSTIIIENDQIFIKDSKKKV